MLIILLQRLLVIDHPHHLHPTNARGGRRRNLGHFRSHGERATPSPQGTAGSSTPTIIRQRQHLANYHISTLQYWSAIEINIGILAASIPSFKALAKRYAPALLGSSNRGGSDYKLGGGASHSAGASRTLSSNKLARFHMMDKSRSGREVDIHASKGDDDDGAADFGSRQTNRDGSTSRTGNGRGGGGGGPYNVEDNSSEEAIYMKRQPPPEGKIGVRTDIATFYEDA